jgi:AcrR family transcriptional regulator
MSKAEKTKQFIIEKTAPLFNTKGYNSTSLSDITQATGLTKEVFTEILKTKIR